ncbi:beta-ketoacyl synthase N-terminal-like domain-containing protein [Streptomyces sp. E11-3]|uniref:type I polyketide synthase n=1 Tax=Streptomyces sp. E11-3 TaxID=3110112 RepID=UPI0039807833
MADIAIVGLDCAFPGARGTDAYWDLLMHGRDPLGDIPEQRWDPRDFTRETAGSARCDITRGGFVEDADSFDNDFFAVSPREAAAMDPQQRLLLQCAWRATEDSGQAPGQLDRKNIGVFIGALGSEWAQVHLSDYPRVTSQLGAGSSAGMAANRISYHLGFTGPSLVVDTACSSSLVAVHLACNALLAGECDQALAGGVNLALTPALGIVYTQLGVASASGRCRPFGAEADGIVRSDGVGVVVLRRLEDALADGQQVYAVIRGTAVNQDGRSHGITAPNRWSQQAVVEAAYRRAGVRPEQVRFLEAHGTGTALGDMIEASALGGVHAVEREQPCAIGSVKGNIGHTEGAAGIAGLIKVALALRHRVVPAARFGSRENPQLRLRERGLSLLKAPLRLPPGEVVAGLSSFGMGGTNAHAVLASAPRTGSRAAGRGRGGRLHPVREQRPAAGVFTLTADTPDALRRNLIAQAELIGKRPRGDSAGLCWTSNRAKTGLPYRCAVVARDTVELAAQLRATADDERLSAGVIDRPASAPTVAFLFSGQGSHFPAMTAGLYQDCATYRHFMDEADAALSPYTGASVRDLILAADPRVHQTAFTQPALFAVGYALARTLVELGIEPEALLGHGVGEFAAAVIGGALSLADAARLVAARGALMQYLPSGGAMYAVRAGQDTLRELVEAEPDVEFAAFNGPRDVVLSGSRPALERLVDGLAEHGVRGRDLGVAHAFHSALMEPAAERFAAVVSALDTAPSRIPFFSTLRGGPTGDDPLDGAYWTAQARQPVRFDAALASLTETVAPTHLLEIGPGLDLHALARRAGLPAGVQLLHPSPGEKAGGRELVELVAALYRAGLNPAWDALYPPEQRVPERLAPYAFSTAHRFWTKEPAPAAVRRRPVSVERPRTVDDPAGKPADPVLAAVLTAVSEVGAYDPGRVVPSARFYEDLGFDSVMLMQLKDVLETQLPQAGGVSVQQLLPALHSVATLADFLSEWITVETA